MPTSNTGLLHCVHGPCTSLAKCSIPAGVLAHPAFPWGCQPPAGALEHCLTLHTNFSISFLHSHLSVHLAETTKMHLSLNNSRQTHLASRFPTPISNITSPTLPSIQHPDTDVFQVRCPCSWGHLTPLKLGLAPCLLKLLLPLCCCAHCNHRYCPR